MLPKKPIPMLKTYLGNIAYSPKLLSDEILEPYICQVELSELLGRDFQSLSMKDLFKVPSNQYNLISIRNMENGLVSIT